MRLYEYKKLDLGFVVLCPEPSISALQVTVNGLRTRYDSPVIAVVPGDTMPEMVSYMGKICPVFQGQDTVTSLINAGFNHMPSEWGMTIMAGTRVIDNVDVRYSYFVEDTSDVLYAIVDGFYEFPDCSLNGIMVHRDTWKKVGHFCPTNVLPVCKLLWAQEAIDRGCKLKAVMGVRMF